MADKPNGSKKLFPFEVAYWNKKNKEGKDYQSVSLTQSVKDKDGKWSNVNMYLFPEDLLKIASLCEQCYWMVKDNEPARDNASGNTQQAQNVQSADADDYSIPF